MRPRLDGQSRRPQAQRQHGGFAVLWAWWLVLCASSSAAAQELKLLSIEELMQIDVTSTARRAEPVGVAAAAVSVITGDDIRRAGAYAEMNLRLGWQVTPRADVWIVGHDLLHGHHPELGPPVPRRVEFERGFRVGTTLRF